MTIKTKNAGAISTDLSHLILLMPLNWCEMITGNRRYALVIADNGLQAQPSQPRNLHELRYDADSSGRVLLVDGQVFLGTNDLLFAGPFQATNASMTLFVSLE